MNELFTAILNAVLEYEGAGTNPLAYRTRRLHRAIFRDRVRTWFKRGYDSYITSDDGMYYMRITYRRDLNDADEVVLVAQIVFGRTDAIDAILIDNFEILAKHTPEGRY